MASGSPGSAATPAFPPGVASSFLSIHAVRIFVRDLDRSLRFYLGQLGFRLVIDTRLQSGERWVAVSPPDGTAILALVVPHPGPPSTGSLAAPRMSSSSRPTWRAGSRSGRGRASVS